MGMRLPSRSAILPGGEVVKIVAITASVLVEQQDEILEAGCDELVRKPFQEHEIFDAIARLLDVEYIYEQDSEAGPAQRHGLTSLPPCWPNSLQNYCKNCGRRRWR